MHIEGIGAGPAALYFAVLMKRAFPEVSIRLTERNQPDDTFGWGVVFSDETLGHFEAADPVSFAEIRHHFRTWTDIDTWVGPAPGAGGPGTWVKSTGHGFCGLARRTLLRILHERCRSLGVELAFGHEIASLAEVPPADLVLAADGVHSFVRDTHPAWFGPSLDWRRCKFTWMGTTLPLDAFTFLFLPTEHGLFQVHAYPFERHLSTWIVECHESVWRRAGLDRADEAATVALLERLFAGHLRGHRLLTNRSIWRTFPTVRNARWHHDRVVLLGDAAHTAHFSIGSGTKLAMEDAIALVDAFRRHGLEEVPRALAAYEAARRDEVERLQHAAQTSLEWFENSARYVVQDPVTFTFNLMTRSKRITYENLARRDPALVRRAGAAFARAHGVVAPATGPAPVPCFVPFACRGVTLPNRIVVSPMCQYSAADGVPTDWHLVHLGSFATGGAGLVFTEMTDVCPEGRITRACAGMYSDRQEEAWARIVDFFHRHSPGRIGMQLAHAGRKGSCTLPWEGDRPLPPGEGWPTLGPTAEPFWPGAPAPRAMDRADMDRVREAFVQAARRAARAGFDVLEVHMAHGYLLSAFLSGLVNRRRDEYGGSLEGRLRYPLEVLRAVRAAWPAERLLFVRISASDWTDDPDGLTPDDAVGIARALGAAGADVIDVSSGGNSLASRPVYGRMYQVPFAEQIRAETGLKVMAVGGIQGVDHANTILAAGRADLCALARAHLLAPHLTLAAAARYRDATQRWPAPYQAARPAPGDWLEPR